MLNSDNNFDLMLSNSFSAAIVIVFVAILSFTTFTSALGAILVDGP